MRLYTGHIPAMDIGGAVPAGLDVLLEVHDDGHMTVATRPGRDQGWISWSPPMVLKAAQVTS